jgi:hypothetical protein
MNPKVYDVCLLTGLLLIAGGVACWSVPAALVVTGTLVIALTLAGAVLTTRRGGN